MDRRTMISVLAGVVATPSFAQLSKSPSPDAVDSKPYDVLQPAIAADRKTCVSCSRTTAPSACVITTAW